jgi:hypothetical protein
MRRLELIERNRLLLAVKLFPVGLLCANPFFFVLRLTAGLAAARRGAGDTAHFPGIGGKWRIARSLLRGHVQGLCLAHRMWRKRSQLRKIRRLNGAEVRRLIFANRLPLRDVA